MQLGEKNRRLVIHFDIVLQQYDNCPIHCVKIISLLEMEQILYEIVYNIMLVLSFIILLYLKFDKFSPRYFTFGLLIWIIGSSEPIPFEWQGFQAYFKE